MVWAKTRARCAPCPSIFRRSHCVSVGTIRSRCVSTPCIADGQNTPALGQSAPRKIFRFTEIRKRRRYCGNPAQRRGAYRDRHERGSGRGGRGSHRRDQLRRAGNRERRPRATTGVACVRQNRVVLAPGVCAPSVAVMWRPDRARASVICKATGAIVHRSPRRVQHKPSNHCAGKAGMSWLHLYAAVQLLTTQNSHSGPRVPAGSRSSLRPLSFEGEASKQNSGEMRREDAMVCPQ